MLDMYHYIMLVGFVIVILVMYKLMSKWDDVDPNRDSGWIHHPSLSWYSKDSKVISTFGDDIDIGVIIIYGDNKFEVKVWVDYHEGNIDSLHSLGTFLNFEESSKEGDSWLHHVTTGIIDPDNYTF